MSTLPGLSAPSKPEFRLRLDRRTGAWSQRRMLVIGQNPSTAGPGYDDKNDPTITTLIKIARRLNYGYLTVGNLSPKIETNSKAFFEWLYGPQWNASWHLPEAWDALSLLAEEADLVIAAWGRWHAVEPKYEPIPWPTIVRGRLASAVIPLHVFGLNADGTPRYPMARGKHRLPADVVPVLWELSK